MYAAVTVPRSSSSSSYARFVTLANRQHGGARFGALGGLVVTVADMEQLDAKIRNLNTDVFAAELPPPPSGDLEATSAHIDRVVWLMGFRWSWTSFRVRWNAWVDSHGTFEWLEDSPQEFGEFQRQYNEFLRQFREGLGNKATSATKAKPEEKEPDAADVAGAVKFASLAVVALVGAYLVSKAT